MVHPLLYSLFPIPYSLKHYAQELITLVVTLMAHGCPLQAIVVAFALDERTVASWVRGAGQHCAQVHEHLVQAGAVDTRHIQADELWVKLMGGRALRRPWHWRWSRACGWAGC